MTETYEGKTAEPLATLTGITNASGVCDTCGRELGRVFQVRYPDGAEATLGRRCAAKATGYAASLIERKAAHEARMRVKADADRAAGLTLDDMIARAESIGAAWTRLQMVGWYRYVYGVDPA